VAAGHKPGLHFHDHFSPSELAALTVTVLASGGIESAVLLSELSKRCRQVVPLYFECGLSWEPVEKQHLMQYLRALAAPNVSEVTAISLPIRDLYRQHWSVTGLDVPDSKSDDSAVFLPGRNILLLSKAAVFCSLNEAQAIAMGPLAANPFADATDDFFAAMESAVSIGLDRRIAVMRPFKSLHKPQVVELGANLPLHLTMSCIQPVANHTEGGGTFMHCGDCNKCAERQKGFMEAGYRDTTKYAAVKTPASIR
jgi:7-cyano-7-deazaguanine synthase